MLSLTKITAFAILSLSFASKATAADVTIWSCNECTGSRNGANCNQVAWSQDDGASDCNWRETGVDPSFGAGTSPINTHGKKCSITLNSDGKTGNVDCSGAGGSASNACAATTQQFTTNSCGLTSACNSWGTCSGSF